MSSSEIRTEYCEDPLHDALQLIFESPTAVIRDNDMLAMARPRFLRRTQSFGFKMTQNLQRTVLTWQQKGDIVDFYSK